MKTRKKFLALVVSTLLLVTMMAVPVSAANYGVVKGTSCKFNKYLVMDKDAKVPNAEFTFTIAPISEKIGATTTPKKTMEILPGPAGIKFTGAATDAPRSIKVTFSPSDSTTAEKDASADETIKFVTTNDNTDEIYAKKEISVDLSGVSFSEPGIYRWVITESNSVQKGITNDTVLTRVLDVYVIDNNGALEVSSYVLHEGNGSETVDAGNNNGSADVAEQNAKLENKSTGFTNQYESQNLTFGKEVTGNQGSKDKYFKFTVTAEKNDTTDTVNSSDVFTVETNADAKPTANGATTYNADVMEAANKNTLNEGKITGAQLIAGKDFYLQDGQYVTIKGLPKGFKYNVEEVPEDYKSTSGIEADISTHEHDSTHDSYDQLKDGNTGTIEDKDIYTGFTNTRDGIIPTGILLSATPWIILGIVAVAGIIFFAIRSKKSYENE